MFDLNLSKENILVCVSNELSQVLDFEIKVGFELEFYLLSSDGVCVDNENRDIFIRNLSLKLSNENINFLVKEEKGACQIEISSDFISDFVFLCKSIENLKKIIDDLALNSGFKADFSGKVFDDDCFSALQFSFSFSDEKGENILSKKKNVEENSIAGILSLVDETIIFSVKNKDDFLRFDLNLNRNLFKKGKFTAPVNLSYGFDNRTALVRVLKNRIEYRLPSSNCDSYLALSALLFSVYFGIKNNLKLDEKYKIFGNAFDEKYDLKEFVKDYDLALKKFFDGEFYGFLKGCEGKSL